MVEVLSPSTQHFDRHAKLLAYQKLPGLQHIVLLSSMEPAAWAYARDAEGAWLPLAPWPRGTALTLPGLPQQGQAVTLGWDEVYAGVGLG